MGDRYDGYGFKVIKIKFHIGGNPAACDFLSLDPLKLISSGSMIITTPNGSELLKILHENNIKATEIGCITFEKEFLLIDGEDIVKINSVESDELYKARKMKG